MSAPPLSSPPLELLMLLGADPADAVVRVLLERGTGLGLELLAIPVPQLLEEVAFDDTGWSLRGRRIDPATTAIINRLPMADRFDGVPLDVSRRLWARLRRELERFAYVSSLPTATSILGCRGSLLDQWIDMPRLVPGLRVPVHATPASSPALTGDRLHAVDRWALYHLGRPPAEATDLAPDRRLDYLRPPGRLVTLAQVGGSMFFANPPPEMTAPQADAIVAFARALARVSPLRIVEHVFFLGGAAPVFYSTCPLPVLAGSHPLYPELVLQGLRDDFQKWRRTAGR